MTDAALAQLRKVVRHAEYVLGDSSLFAEDIGDLRRFFATRPDSYSIDYERNARAFAAGFFVKNYWHQAALLLKTQGPLPPRVLDWGGGAGATSLAYLTACQLQASDQQCRTVSITLFDRSLAQLELAESMLAALPDLFPDLRVRFSAQQSLLSNWNPSPGEFDVILFGHVLTENEPLVKTVLSNGLDAVVPGGSILVFEDSFYPVWCQIGDAVSALPVPRRRSTTSAADLVELAVKYQGDEDLSTTCLALSSLRSPHAYRLLSLYFQSWRERSLDLLDSVFTQDASYIDNVTPAALCGLASIRDYWCQHVLVQTDFTLRILRVFEYGDDIACEWSASFDSPVHGGPVRFDGTIIISIDPKQGKIGKLTEYVNRLPLGGL